MADAIPNLPGPYVGYNVAHWIGYRFLYSNGAAAGVFTASCVIPAYTLILDMIVTSHDLWNQGTTAAIIVGDGDDPDGFFVSSNLKATDLLKYESIGLSGGTGLAGGRIGAYVANSQWCLGSGVYGQFSPAVRTLTATLTTTGSTATTGDIYWFINVCTFSGSEPIRTATYAAT